MDWHGSVSAIAALFRLTPFPLLLSISFPSPCRSVFSPAFAKAGGGRRTDGRTDAGTHMPRTRTHAHVRKRTDGRMLARCFSPSSGEQTRNGATHLGSRAETPFRDTFFSPRHSLRARERRTHLPLSLSSQVQRRPDGRAAHRTHTCVNADNSPATVEEAARCALTQYAFLSGYLICLPVCPALFGYFQGNMPYASIFLPLCRASMSLCRITWGDTTYKAALHW